MTHPAPDHPVVFPSLTYDDAAAAIDWLGRAFGFQRRLVVPGEDGSVRHSELSLGRAVFMVSSPRPEVGRASPRQLAGLHTTISVYVADPDGHHARAVGAGAEIIQPLEDAHFGGRGYIARDPWGHQWYFGSYVPGAHWDQPAAE